MKYVLLMNYSRNVPRMTEWAPEEIKASGAHMMAIHEELVASGELVGAEGLTGPEAARIVTYDGVGAPVVTDGPFPEAREFLAGYWLIDVGSEERAIEIAARTSAAPEMRTRSNQLPEPGLRSHRFLQKRLRPPLQGPLRCGEMR